MTPADQARANAISFECKKDALRQMQNGDWRVAFTIQGIDMDERITKAPMGTRFQAVLVEVDDDEQPIRREAMQNPGLVSNNHNVRPRLDAQAGAKRAWIELKPSTAAAIRCNDAIFRAYLNEVCGFDAQNADDAAVVVRQLCQVETRADLNIDEKAKLRWQALDEQYLAWRELERA